MSTLKLRVSTETFRVLWGPHILPPLRDARSGHRGRYPRPPWTSGEGGPRFQRPRAGDGREDFASVAETLIPSVGGWGLRRLSLTRRVDGRERARNP